jgi:NAD+ synthase
MSNPSTVFSADVLALDPEQATIRIVNMIRQATRRFKRRGAVVALSGGIDSSVVGALCVRALGAARVFGLSLPERDSSAATPALSRLIIEALGIAHEEIDITPLLSAAGCYHRRQAAVCRVIPAFADDWTFKIVLPPVTDNDQYRLYSVVAQSPTGAIHKERLPPDAYLEILAATNFKQRVRKMMEYFHADRLNYMVGGTPNLLEYDQGFFVKLGDGAADVKPIAHLYKTQVYQLADYLGVPAEIRNRPPTTDTYSMPQSQEEFYFSVPYAAMDLCLYAYNHGLDADTVAPALGWQPEQVTRVYRDIEAKRAFAQYLHAAPVALDGPP